MRDKIDAVSQKARKKIRRSNPGNQFTREKGDKRKDRKNGGKKDLEHSKIGIFPQKISRKCVVKRKEKKDLEHAKSTLFSRRVREKCVGEK